jgi:polyketide synthase PksM
LIVEEYCPAQDIAVEVSDVQIIVLSARLVEQLQAKVAQLSDYLSRHEVKLADLAWTLQTGREAMAIRLAMVVTSQQQLQERLEALRNGVAGLAGVYQGEAAPLSESVPTLSEGADALAASWVSGVSVDWAVLYQGRYPRRLSLPLYPFARERCWGAPAAGLPAAGAVKRLHPLIESNISDLHQQRYHTRLNGQEWFLRDHVVQGRAIVPAVIQLEWARAAVSLALEGVAGQGELCLYDVAWLKPLEVTDAVDVNLSLEPLSGGDIGYRLYSGDAGEPQVYSQGRARLAARERAPSLDLNGLRSRCERSLNGEALYQRFSQAGLSYGTVFKVIKTLHTGDGVALAELAIADETACLGYTWLPDMLDGALQSCAGIMNDGGLALPFSLNRIEAWHMPPSRAWVVIQTGKGDTPALRKLDIAITDEQGAVALRLQGYTMRPTQTGGAAQQTLDDARDIGTFSFIPAWQTVNDADTPQVPWPQPYEIVLSDGLTPAQIFGMLGAETDIQHLLWRTDVPEPLMLGLRLVRALLEAGYGKRPLALTVITTQGMAVFEHEQVDPRQSSVHGLIGVLAKEYPHWRVRLLDLPAGGVAQGCDWQTQPADPQGNTRAWREGAWHQQSLLPYTPAAVGTAQTPYRQGGVYVVLGGAGGLGVAWSEHLIRRCQAQLVWLGRREEDNAIRSQCDRLSRFGPRPLYLQVDATDVEALELARETVTARFGAIHGVVHATIVLADRTLALMDESCFESVLRAKTVTADNMDAVFGALSLDFMLFFSSMQSLSRSLGQSNYSAGCCYIDALAHHLRHRAYPVKVMSWGYWGSVGVVAQESYRTRMAQLGFGSIEPEEAMPALEQLLVFPGEQMALVKTTKSEATRLLSQGARSEVALAARAGVTTSIQVTASAERLAQAGELLVPLTALEKRLAPLLWAQLAQLGWLDDQTPLPHYRQWRDAALVLLYQAGVNTQDPAPVWQKEWARWQDWSQTARQDPALGAQIRLVEVTLGALDDVLLDTRTATEVIFPQGNTELVEGIYRGHPVADTFNDLLADQLIAWVQARLEQEPAARLRILEIGAGTGGTSAVLFERLAPWAGQIEEYTYTDVSGAFLVYARTHFQPRIPYLKLCLFDVERSPRGQNLTPGSYDVVLATNVLHATRDIRHTVTNAKALLKGDGILLINEIAEPSVFAHLTFGLLDGWWLAQDTPLRLRGTPALSAAAWRQVLEDAGFNNVVTPEAELHVLGQQIIRANSDGVMRLARVTAAQAQPGAESLSGAGDELKATAIRHLRRRVAEILKMPEAQVKAEEPLSAYGVDSILAVQIAQALGEVFTGVDATLLFEHPSIDALAGHFTTTQRDATVRWLGGASQTSGHRQEAVRPIRRFIGTVSERAETQDIAIIGLSGRYPKAANLEQYWQNLRDGVDCISEIPLQRWDWRRDFDEHKGVEGKSYSKWGGFIDDADAFDPLFFNLAPREAERMDPQERLLLQCAWSALEDAGYTPATLAPQGRAGVFIGSMNSHYTIQPAQWSLANRISSLFNLRGPSLTVDTACSSSLTAIHLALESLKRGEIDCAIAGGVNLIVDPVQYQTLSAMTMLSEDNRCCAFGAGANGFVDGEGVGVAVLKPLARAVEDGDHIYGVIKGSALNHGGKTGGFTVPDPKAQAAVVEQALNEAGVDARCISYVEAHGSGTALGDPIEISGLTQAFRQHTQDAGFCAIGSVKASIGHCESAAGIAGLTKVLLQMQYGQYAKSLHSEVLNPHIDFQATPFTVQQQTQPWPRPVVNLNGVEREYPRLAGVSSFGAGGANAHLIVEEYPAQQQSDAVSVSPVIVVLSARRPERLQAQMRQLLAYLEQHRVSLYDLSYTLQVGREEMSARIALVVDSQATLIERLRLALQGETLPAQVYRGEVKPHQDLLALFSSDDEMHEAMAKWLARGKLDKLAECWANGVSVDWGAFYDDMRPARLSLPTYPFAKESYWQPQRRLHSVEAENLHPLVHRNTSDFSQQRYSTRLTGSEWFLHPCRKVPAAVLLEWARAALALAGGMANDGARIALHDVGWPQTLSVDAPREVHISLRPQDDGRVAWQIYDDAQEPALVFCQGYASFMTDQNTQVIDVAALHNPTSQWLEAPAIYAGAEQVGESFRVLRSVSRDGDRLIGRLEITGDHSDFFWPPAALDGVLQVSEALWSDGGNKHLPATIRDIQSWERLPARAWVIAEPAVQSTADQCWRDITVADDHGQVVLRLTGVAAHGASDEAERVLALPEWTSQVLLPADAAVGQHWLLVCEVALPPEFIGVFGAEHCLVLNAQGALAQRYDDAVRQLLEHVRQRAVLPQHGPVTMQLLLPANGAGQVMQGLAALMRSVACEYPHIATQAVLMDGTARYEAEQLTRLLQAEAGGGAPIVRYTDGRREVPVWFTPENQVQVQLPWRDEGVYWITGGLGGLGRQFANAIAQVINPVLILNGRAACTSEQEVFIQALRERGATVEIHALDVSDRASVEQLIGDILARHGRLNGVIHCAGALCDRLVPNITEDDLQQVLAAKTRGVEIIDEATRSLKLDWLILCSSLAGAWGNIGQSAYAAANGFMDGYARYRQSLVERGERHGQTLSIGWPLWAAGGMQLDAERQTQLFNSLGMRALPTEEALVAMAQLLHQSVTYGVVLYGQRRAIRQWLHHSSVGGEQPTAPTREGGAVLDAERLQRVECLIGDKVMEHLKLPAEALDRDTPFNELGFDSVSLTTFGNMLNTRYGLTLTPTIFFTAPTLAQFAEYLVREHYAAFAEPVSVAADERRPARITPPTGLPQRTPSPLLHRLRSTPITTREGEPVAIIGMSGNFPQSPGIDVLWDNLTAGRDCIGELPVDRWPGPPPALRHAGVLDDVAAFDPLFFGISPREAQAMDPQQRLLMTYVHQVIEEAGYSVNSLSGSNTALLVATGSTGYGHLMAQAGSPISGFSSIGISTTMGPNRMSYWLNWHGPSEAIDTACSSSLVAVHRAMALLRSGQCDQAVVGGVNTLMSLEAHESFVLAGMLSQNGHCHTFSNQADGYVRSEAAAMLFLKPLAAAQRDGDHIYGLLLGSAENHGGRAASLTAPNPRAQEQVIIAAHRQAGIDPRSVGYIEAHGTGTPLGDPIEIEGIRQAFRVLAQEQELPAASCGLGSVKSHIGHLELAAGVAGLIKTVLQLRHRKLVANLNCLPLNPAIKLDDSPLYVVSETRDWPAAIDEKGRTLPRSAGVSSFGFGGVNAHVVVQEYLPPQSAETVVTYPLLIVLSARNAQQLRERIAQLSNYLDQHQQEVNLADLAWTLQVGRDAMAHRLALIVRSEQDLNDKLQSVMSGNTVGAGIYQGEIKSHKGTMAQFDADEDLRGAVQSWIAKGKLGKLAEFWVQGLEIDWLALHHGKTARRLSLPTYPFARDRYWLPEAEQAVAVNSTVPHPLVQRNTSDLNRQRYSITLTGQEWFLRDHIVQGQPIVPGVVQLEWARAAAMLQLGGEVRNAEIALQQVVWLQPLAVSGAMTVYIALEAVEDGRIRYEIYREDAGQAQVYGQGYARQSEVQEAPWFDLAALRKECNQHLDGEWLYQQLERGGLYYGDSLRVVRHIAAGRDMALGELAASALPDVQGYRWRPELMDGALHTLIGLLCDKAEMALPFALQEVTTWGPMPQHVWALARPAVDRTAGQWDIDIIDEQGRQVMRLAGFSTRAIREPVNGTPLVKVPRTAPTVSKEQAVEPERCGDLALIPFWAADVREEEDWPDAVELAVDLNVGIGAEELSAQLPDAVQHLIWRVRSGEVEPVLAGLRLVKALLARGYASQALHLSIITTQALGVGPDEPADASQAALHGLMGSLAKEYPHWRIRILDLPGGIPEADIDWQRQPADSKGNSRAWREGRWLRETLAPCRPEAPQRGAYRQGGVYVVLGGAGGLGMAFSEYLVREYQAQLVWLGRRAEDETLRAGCERLAALGPQPLYLQADASDRDALELAYGTIRERFGVIHGVVHSAIVLADQSLARMDEARFASALMAKTETALNLDAVFGAEALDFMLYFSSLQSFSKSPGQSNYAAGCCWQDAFAHAQRARRPYAVKVMHWGYWGSVGVVADELYRARMARLGLGSVEAAPAMAALETLLCGPLNRQVFVNVSGAVAAQALADESGLEAWVADAVPAVTLAAGNVPEVPDVAAVTQMEQRLLPLLWSRLAALGWLAADFVAPRGYRRWRETSLALLRESSVNLSQPAPDWDTAWAEWQADCAPLSDTPQIRLVNAMLEALPAILCGETAATAVMFPQNGQNLVEAVYHGNPLNDAFNALLADRLESYLRARGPQARLRILEIGAGTGGTSVMLFERLKPYVGQIEEYCYTDISPYFLQHADQHYAAVAPYLRTQRLDIERSPQAQGIAAGCYDVVVAANVLHATREIATTLRHTRSVMKRNGLLLLNEIATFSLFSHLTFGLLDGWWQAQDIGLRLPGTPALAPAMWQRVLARNGFSAVRTYAASGLQIVEAMSDGVLLLAPQTQPAPRPVTVVRQKVTGPAGQVEKILSGLIAEHLKLPPEELDRDTPLTEFGFDSITLTSFGQVLNDRYGLTLSPTVFFEAPTLADLADYLGREHPTAFAPSPTTVGNTPPVEPHRASISPVLRQSRPATRAEPVAIVGMSGSFPQSADIDVLWRNLQAGRDCIDTLPAARWGPLAPAAMPQAGVLDAVEYFDPLFFGISPREALSMDPQQRLLMQHVCHVIEDAGYSVQSLSGSNTALLVGTNGSGYARLLYQTGMEVEGFSAAGVVSSMGPNRMSYWLNWHGPSEPIETACSSSLVAIHRAVGLLRSGQCELAVAGGVNTLLSPEAYQSFSIAGMLSPGGRCRTFSAQADGYVRGEGVGMLMLKPLSAAERDGDHIYGLIVGSAENHGGRAASLTAPNPIAQARLIEQAVRESGVDPRALGYIEAHGTGTALGDPIEVQGLHQAFRALSEGGELPVGSCGLGTIKSNIGHLEMAAGVAGVIKTVLQLQHRQLVPSLNSQPLNPHIQLENSPFFVVSDAQAWVAPTGRHGETLPRSAGVSSFGFGGVNAHILLQEYPTPGRRTADEGAVMVVLSARSESALRQRVEQLYSHLSEHEESLTDLAYTLQVGRDAMEHRMALVADCQRGLMAQLRGVLDGVAVENIWCGEVKSVPTEEFSAGDESPQELVQLWIKGFEIDWPLLYTGRQPNRLRLPTYPFARERFWFPENGLMAPGLIPHLHPLVHRNLSGVHAFCYDTQLTGQEWFLRDHQVMGRAVLPGVAQLEWARAAVSLALSGEPDGADICLKNVVWLQQLTVTTQREIHIELTPEEEGGMRWEIYSDEDGGEVIYSQGQAAPVLGADAPVVDMAAVAACCTDQVDGAWLYAQFAGQGLDYGEGMRAVQTLRGGNGLALAALASVGHRDSCLWSPSLLDGALQAIAGTAREGDIALPFALRELRAWSALPDRLQVIVQPGRSNSTAAPEWDITLVDDEGSTVMQLLGVTMRPVKPGAGQGAFFTQGN